MPMAGPLLDRHVGRDGGERVVARTLFPDAV
jgi:hypothetical protein